MKLKLKLKRKTKMALPKKNEAEKEVETVAEVETSSEETPEEKVEEILDQPTEQAEKVIAANTEIQAAPTTTAVAEKQNNAVAQLEESGFGGLAIDWTSFPTIVLDNGDFCTADGVSLEIREFVGRLVNSRKRYVFRTKVASEDDEPELAYTYDLSEMNDPSSELALKIVKWKEEDDLDYVVKEYIEALAVIVDEACPLNEQMVLLQIPPTAVGKFSGYVTSNQLIKGLLPTQYLTRFYAGNKVTKTKKPFVPWAFEFSSTV